MSPVDLVALDEDHHVHSTWSDDARSTIEENLDTATARGLRRIRLTEHVRRSTAWLPAFTAAVARLHRPAGLDVRTAVEAKILDVDGTLDLPDDLAGVGSVLLADHRFPSPAGPWSPSETRERLASGLTPHAALDLLVDALVAAMGTAAARGVPAQLAHCFSILPKVGLAEADLTDVALERWAEAAARTGTAVEVNEKWACPGPRVVAAAHAAGVALVASTDSHVHDDVGRYTAVRSILAAVADRPW